LKDLDLSAVVYQIVLTKADQVKPAELEKRIAETRQKLARRPAAYPEILVTSSHTGLGIETLRATIAKLLAERGLA
jgi:GTP-binding protein